MLKNYFPNILQYTIGKMLYFKVSARDVWNCIFFLKKHTYTLCNQLTDLSAVDYPEKKYRFEIFYLLLSFKYNNRVVVTTSSREGCYVDSITSIYPAANWYERETWDMFGLFFRNHPDLRRILTDYGFKGHPMRKDFPLTGFTEARYSDSLKRVVYEKVSLTQEFRVFNLANNWKDN